MHPDTMRLIDRWVGIPLCFFASLWPWKKTQAGSTSPLSTNIPPPDTIVFIGIAEIGALVVAYPAIQESRINTRTAEFVLLLLPVISKR